MNRSGQRSLLMRIEIRLDPVSQSQANHVFRDQLQRHPGPPASPARGPHALSGASTRNHLLAQPEMSTQSVGIEAAENPCDYWILDLPTDDASVRDSRFS